MARQSRRAPSTGSISSRPRKDGRWEAKLTLPDGRRKSFYGATWAEAEAKLTQARRELEDGAFAEPGRATLNDVWRDYARLNPFHLRHRSMLKVTSHWENRIGPVIGHVRLRSLTPAHLYDVIGKARKAGLSDYTVRDIFSSLKGVLQFAVEVNLLASNPALRVKAPTGGDSRDLPITDPEDIQRLYEAIIDHRHGIIMVLGLGLGLRSAEARGLRWENVDLEAGVVRIRNGIDTINGEVIFTPLKTRSSRRDLPIPGFVAEEFRAQRRRQAERRLRLGPDWQDHDLVCTRTGYPVSYSTLTDALRDVCKSARLPRLTFHHLRHLCATMMMVRNVPPRLAQAILGHATSDTTMRIYQHVKGGSLDDAREALDSAIVPRSSRSSG